MFQKIKSYFEQGLWTKEMVRHAVEKGRISRDEYFTITGEQYM